MSWERLVFFLWYNIQLKLIGIIGLNERIDKGWYKKMTLLFETVKIDKNLIIFKMISPFNQNSKVIKTNRFLKKPNKCIQN